MKKLCFEWASSQWRKLPLEGPMKPFPGKYPTRVFVEIFPPGRKPIRYFGKPSVFVGKLLANATANAHINAMEFDRGGVVRQTWGNIGDWVLPNGSLGAREVAPTKYARYYPFSVNSGFGELSVRTHSKVFTIAGKRVWVYSALERLVLAKHVIPFKQRYIENRWN